MQAGVTHTRDQRLLGAAALVADDDAGLAEVLRQSRLEAWWETDYRQVREYELIMEEDEARQRARDVLVGRLTVPSNPGAYETVIEDGGLTLGALETVIGLADMDVVEAAQGELASQDPASPVPCQTWNGLWFRSQAEVRIAEALDRANVAFLPNPSARVGITHDHRTDCEPDFVVIDEGRLGILEVDGPWHNGTAHQDHERDRRFREHGIAVVERFAFAECRETPDDVVARFLRLLRVNG
jgi:Protein of unknown function (DUF559)